MELPGMGGKGKDAHARDLDGSHDKTQLYLLLGIGLVLATLTVLCLIIWGLKRCRKFLKNRKKRRRVVPVPTEEAPVSATTNQAKESRQEHVAIWIEDEVEGQTDESWTTASSEQEDCSVVWTRKEEVQTEMTQMRALPTGQMAIFNEFIEEQVHAMEERPSYTVVSLDDMDEEETDRPCSAVMNGNGNTLDEREVQLQQKETMKQETYQLNEASSTSASLNTEQDDELRGGIEIFVPMDRQMPQWVTIEMEEEVEDTTELIPSPPVMRNIEGWNEEPIQTEDARLEIPLAPIRWNVQDDEHMPEYKIYQVEKQEGHIASSVDRNNHEAYQYGSISLGIQEEEVDYSYNDDRMQEEGQNIENYEYELSDENNIAEHQEILAPVSLSLEDYDETHVNERKAPCGANEDMNQDENIGLVLVVNDDEIIKYEPMLQTIFEDEKEEDNNDDHDYSTQHKLACLEDYYCDFGLPQENDTNKEHRKLVAPISPNKEDYDSTNTDERKGELEETEAKNQDDNNAIGLDMNDVAILEEEPMIQAAIENKEDDSEDSDFGMENETQNIREHYYDYETPEKQDLEENDPIIQDSIKETTEATGSSSEESIPITETGDQLTKDKPLSAINYTLPAFDLNTNEDTTLAYILTSDDDDQLGHSSDAGNPESIANVQTSDEIAVESDANSDQDRRGSNPVQQDRLTGRHLLEGEPVDPGETNVNASDAAASAWQTALNMDSNLLDYAQAEGGWIRKKVDHYNIGPSHATELHNTVDVLGFGPGILTTILEPVNRFVTSLISPGESRMLLIEPDQAPLMELKDYNDQDQESIRAEMTRLTRPRKPPGLISVLDFCQAEGSPHQLPQNNTEIPATFSLRHATLNSSARIDDTEMPLPPTDEELEKEEQEEYAKLANKFGVAGNEPTLPSDTATNEAESEEKPHELKQLVEMEPNVGYEITTDKPDDDLDAVTIQADMSSSPTTTPRNVRQTITAGGIPLELNINLTLQSCCHHASGSKGCCRYNETTTSTRDTSPPGRQSLDPTESRGFQPSTAEVPIGTPTGTCPCAGTGRDVIMCGTENPEHRVYGLTSMLDFMQAEGSPCYAHEDGGGGLNIGSQLASWWGTAVRAITPQSENDDEDSTTEGGLITIKRPKGKKTGTETEAQNPEAEQVISSEIDSTPGTSETTGEDDIADKST